MKPLVSRAHSLAGVQVLVLFLRCQPSALLQSTMTLPVGPYRVKNSPTRLVGGINDENLTFTQKMSKKGIFSTFLSFVKLKPTHF